MPAQIGYFDTLKNIAGKVFTYLASIILTGTDGKTITVTQDTALDEAVAMSSKLTMALGAANLKAFMNAAGTAPEWAKGIVVQSFTRDMGAASGDVSYSEANFMPSCVIIVATVDNAANVFSIGAQYLTVMKTISLIPRTAPIWTVSTTKIIYIEADAADGSKSQAGVLKTWDSIGITITWTKIGAPTAIISGFILFFR